VAVVVAHPVPPGKVAQVVWVAAALEALAPVAMELLARPIRVAAAAVAQEGMGMAAPAALASL